MSSVPPHAETGQMATNGKALPEFSIGEARRIVQDLFEPRPLVYWCDFLVSFAVGMSAFVAVRNLPSLPGQALAFLLSVLALYRAVLFTHELTHLRKGTFIAFRVAWNTLVGIPFLMPSFTYHTHLAHHARRHYGTAEDGEYLPLAAGPAWRILHYLAQSFLIPPLVIGRFLLLAPIAWASPAFRRWVDQHASSMVVDPSYLRPLPSTAERRLWRVQEALCFVCCVSVVWGLAAGVWSISLLVQIYLTAASILLINALRTAVAHRFRNTGGEMTFVEQLLDTINYPHHALTGELWAPVGLRFHALHHLFPSLPYHALPKAHRRLMHELPADSPYRLTESAGFWASMRQLWSEARASQRGSAHHGTYGASLRRLTPPAQLAVDPARQPPSGIAAS